MQGSGMTKKLESIGASPSRKSLAVEAIREAILTMRLVPGERLIERELGESLGVSRPVVREALSQLESEGLVQIIAHRGPHVARYDGGQTRSIYELRAVLEAECGRLFALRAPEAHRHALRNALSAVAKAYGQDDPSGWLAAKAGYYDVLLAGVENPFLADALRHIHALVTLLRTRTLACPGRLETSLDELREITEACVEGDAVRAEKACRDHVEAAARIAQDIWEEESVA